MGVEAWTQEQIDFAIDLWRQGVSGSIIGSRLGRSRCSVLGKLHRMKVTSARPTRVQRPNSTRIARKERHKKRLAEAMAQPASPLAKIMAEPWTPRPLPVVPKAQQRSLVDLADDQCRWPCTDAPPHLFCAGPRVPGASYCPDHLLAAHSNVRAPGSMPHFSLALKVGFSKQLAASGHDPAAHTYPVDVRTLETAE
jgi:hypothetical protein